MAIQIRRKAAETAKPEGFVRNLTGLWREVEALPQLSRGGVALHVLSQAGRSMAASPFTAVITAFTTTVAMFLLAWLLLMVENFSGFLLSTRTELAVSIYLKDTASAASAQKLAAEIEVAPEISEARYYTKDEALRQFGSSLGAHAGVLEGLDGENPLPASIEVRFKPLAGSEAVFSEFAERYGKSELVEHVQYDRGVLNQFNRIIELFRSVGFFATLGMLLITGFIVANTIRLAVYAHRQEIEIMQLVGASRALIRAPFMVEGLLQGILGSAVAIAVLWSVFQFAKGIEQEAEILRAVLPPLRFLSPGACLLVLGMGAFVGLAGSYLAVRRFLED